MYLINYLYWTKPFTVHLFDHSSNLVLLIATFIKTSQIDLLFLCSFNLQLTLTHFQNIREYLLYNIAKIFYLSWIFSIMLIDQTGAFNYGICGWPPWLNTSMTRIWPLKSWETNCSIICVLFFSLFYFTSTWKYTLKSAFKLQVPTTQCPIQKKKLFNTLKHFCFAEILLYFLSFANMFNG